MRRLLPLLFLLLAAPAFADDAPAVPRERIDKSVTHILGNKFMLESPSPVRWNYDVVFEDDGRVSYFYALDFQKEPDKQAVDRLFIFEDFLTVPKGPFKTEIAWSADGTKAALLFHGKVHGVFDFTAKRGYCRSNQPAANAEWSSFDHTWDEAAIKLIQ